MVGRKKIPKIRRVFPLVVLLLFAAAGSGVARPSDDLVDASPFPVVTHAGDGGARTPEEGDPEDQYNLRDLESIVLEKDPGVMTFLEKVREAREQVAETRFRYGPEFTTYYSRYPSGGNLPEEEENVQHWLSVGVRQDLIELLKIRPGRIEAMASRLDAAEASFAEARCRALFELRKLYLRIAEESVRVRLQSERVDILSRMFDVESKRYAHLTTLLPDLLYAQKELIHAEDELDYHRNELVSRKEFLADIVGIRPERIEIESPAIPTSLPPEERWIELATRRRGDIRSLEANAREERAAASTASFDDIRLSAFLGYRLRDSRLSGREGGIGFNVTFTVPVMLWNLRDSRTSRFLARERSRLYDAEEKRREIAGEIHATYGDYARFRSDFDVAAREIGLAGEELRIERLRLENPVGSFESDPVSVLKIEERSVDKKLDKETARSRLLESYYRLLYLSGATDPEDITPRPDDAPIIHARATARPNTTERVRTGGSPDPYVAPALYTARDPAGSREADSTRDAVRGARDNRDTPEHCRERQSNRGSGQ